MAEKVYTYIFIAIGLMVLFNMAGLTTATGSILQAMGIIEIGNVAKINSTAFYIAITVALVALIGTGLTISLGVIKGTVNEVAISAIAASTFILFMTDLVTITTYASEGEAWIGWVVFAIMLPFIFGYALAIYDWVRKV